MHSFFDPASVAVIGASRETGEGSNNIVEMAQRFGYKGAIYPINPKAEQIAGLKAFPSVKNLPETVDLAVVSVGRDRILDIFKDSLDKGIKSFIIISQGFGDADEKGRMLQDEMVRLAGSAGARIVGPNTMGVINAFSGFSSSFIDALRPPEPRPLAVIAQTGILQVGQEVFINNNLGKTIDLGNMSDIDFVDVLEYFEKDSDIKVIAIHMEGLKRGETFLETAGRITQQKPIIVLKTARSNLGAQAALSHTGSLAGEDEVFEIAFQRAGIIRVNDTTEFKDTVKSLLKFPPMSSNKIGVITPSGGAGIQAIDACEKIGLTTPPLSEKLINKLKEVSPEWFSIGNPVDMWPVGINKSYFEVFERTFKEFWQREDIGGIVVGHVALASHLHNDFNCYPIMYNMLKEHLDATNIKKPLSFWLYGDQTWNTRVKLDELPLTVSFSSIERAVRGIGAAHRYYILANQSRNVLEERNKAKSSFTMENMKKIRTEKNVILGMEALSHISSYGISIANTKYARNTEEALQAAGKIGFPIVLKAVASKWLHKTEHGGVITGLKTLQEVKANCSLLAKRAGEGLEGFLIQEQVKGKEILLGIKKDPQFGHVMVCGTGGIYAEVLQDISRELLPLTRKQAEKMLKSLKGYSILSGVRGEKPVNLEMLIDTMLHLAELAMQNPGIVEMDINPLICNSTECKAVDVRIIFNTSNSGHNIDQFL